MKRLSYTQLQMLKSVSRGHVIKAPDGSHRPFECSNTNRTAAALHRLGLIKLADEQPTHVVNAWVLTAAGRELLP